MKRTLYFIKLPLLVCFLISCIAGHTQINVTLKEVKSNISNTKCYDVLLKSDYKQDHYLAGQNYRLYYNAAKALFQENSIVSLLPKQYTTLNLVQHVFDVDASGFGNLTYDHHLGFINLANDYNLTSGQAIILSKGDAITTAHFCMTNPDGEMEINWANQKITHTYSTAFVEVALMDINKKPINAVLGDLKVESLSTNIDEPSQVIDMSIFPNPFKEKFELKLNHALPSDAQVTIEHIIGGQYITMTLAAGSTMLSIQGDALPAGALLIKIKEHDGQVTIVKAIKVD